MVRLSDNQQTMADLKASNDLLRLALESAKKTIQQAEATVQQANAQIEKSNAAMNAVLAQNQMLFQAFLSAARKQQKYLVSENGKQLIAVKSA